MKNSADFPEVSEADLVTETAVVEGQELDLKCVNVPYSELQKGDVVVISHFGQKILVKIAGDFHPSFKSFPVNFPKKSNGVSSGGALSNQGTGSFLKVVSGDEAVKFSYE